MTINSHPLRIGVVIDTAEDYKSRFQVTDEQCGELSPQIQVDATVETLQKLGHKVDLIGSIFDLVERLADITPGQAPWDLVFNVAEGMFGTAREAQVPAMLEAWRIPYTFADATATVTCMDKALTKLKLTAGGIPTAVFFLIPSGQSQNIEILESDKGIVFHHRGQETTFPEFPLFLKPNSEGSSKGVSEKSKITCMNEIRPAIDQLASEYPEQDLLIEPFLAGREVSVGILGTKQKARVLGTLNFMSSEPTITKPGADANGANGFYEHACCKNSLTSKTSRTENLNGNNDLVKQVPLTNSSSTEVKQSVATRSANFLTYQDKSGVRTNEEGEAELQHHPIAEHIDSHLVADAEAIALKAHRLLGLRDCSRFDIRYDKAGPDAKPYILETNVMPGLVPELSAMSHLALNHGMTFKELINMIIESARERIPSPQRCLAYR